MVSDANRWLGLAFVGALADSGAHVVVVGRGLRRPRCLVDRSDCECGG
jgi:NAD(P)-dependent dehydrogenase (short-subunit alcohol dehydrogenase family)